MNAALRRGACPALSAPMATGDGLLARINAVGTIALDAFAGLCAAARAYGNGIVEVTARGSLQVRGLTAESAPLLADAVAALGIEVAEGVPVVVDPLAGLDPLAPLDTVALAAKVRRALARNPRPLAPKTSVVIDGGRLLHLDGLAADVRLNADGDLLHVAVGGDRMTAAFLGAVAPERVAETVVRLLAVLAERGPTARARDVVGAEGASPFRAAVSGMLIEAPAPAVRPAAESVGVHTLGNGRCAVGIGLPFGYVDGSTLRGLMETSRQAESKGVRPAPGRSLLIVGAGVDAARSIDAEAARAGFIVDPSDPRRRIVACPGAPICSSAQIPARTLAPALAAVLATHSGTVHVSGCSKRCASRGPTTYTAVGRDGRCDLFVGDEPAGTVAVGELPQSITHLAAGREIARG